MYEAAGATDYESDIDDVAPLTIGEILARVERRLAWYGLRECALSAVQVLDRTRVVVTLSVEGRDGYCEVLDRWTGAVRYREPLLAAR
jgi:hypothetical protein